MEIQLIQSKIHTLRGQRVMLDFDLAEMYQTETKYLKRAVKRNPDRFPPDFMFELTPDEFSGLRFQFGTSNRGGTRYMPYAFTEQGVAMLSTVLNSETAIRVNIAIMRAFVALNRYALTYAELSLKIAEMEARMGRELADINEVLRWLGEENQARYDEIQTLQTEDEPPADTWHNRPLIGFKTTLPDP